MGLQEPPREERARDRAADPPQVSQGLEADLNTADLNVLNLTAADPPRAYVRHNVGYFGTNLSPKIFVSAMAVLSAVCTTSPSSSFPTVSEQLRASRHKSVADGASRWSNARLNPFLRG